MKKIFFLFILIINFAFSQEVPLIPQKYTANNKGKFFVFWGGNRDNFSHSDIRFWGNNYDFTIKDVVADDKPKGWHIDYINPTRMTIPQTNFRFGYFFSQHYNISVGVDHMKYVMRQFQTVNLSGTIASNMGFDGTYTNQATTMTEDFLTFEHTDGLNYVNTEIARFDDISAIFRISNTDKFQINLTEGVGFGLLFPKTNTMLMGQERHDEFHVSGYGMAAKAGLQFLVFKHYFVQTELKGGYINMSDIRTTYNNSDKASQNFLFLERIVAFGGMWRF